MVQHDRKVQRYGAQEQEQGQRRAVGGNERREARGNERREGRSNERRVVGENERREGRSNERREVEVLLAGKARTARQRDASELKIAIDYVEFPGARLEAGYEEQRGYQRTERYGDSAQRRKGISLPSVGEETGRRHVPKGRQRANRPVPRPGIRRMPEPIDCQRRPEYRRPECRNPEYRNSEYRRPEYRNNTVRRNRRKSSCAGTRRKRHEFIQRLAVSVWALSLVCLVVTLIVLHDHASAAGNERRGNQSVSDNRGVIAPNYLDGKQPDSVQIQGLSATDFARHPEWTEDFLTPNEYSRPGDSLDSVTNIFVHYTANPGTSAAQNRSYFERQKDEHLASVSAHFIIGYEGEIIQCVPLNEVAYAVKSRNYDSISIECCHLEKDGSFTEATYDSLISLLKWLIDVYGLESDDILRHYDCGGKKCPLYYTDHPDAWEELKKDVDKL